MDLLAAVGVGALALACVPWLVGAVYGARSIRAMPKLIEQELVPPERWPSVSILVPALNEVDTLEAATASRLADDYPHLQVVLIDDRSDDGTGELVDRLAASDDRVRALHITELPPGWLGKNHALHQAVAVADGEWLLFTDADVHFAQGTLRRAVAEAERRQLDMLVVMPDVWSNSFLLDITLATFGRHFTLGQHVWAVEDPDSKAYVGVGAFNLVRRSAFERTEGFGWIKLDVADDLALGMMMKHSGARCGVAFGTGLVGLEWYPTLSQMARGLEKNTYALLGFSLPRLLLLSLLLLFVDLAPIAALFGPAWLAALGGAALLVGLVTAALGAAWANRSILPALLIPVGSLIFSWILIRAGVLGALRGGISWRGTFHSSESLRAGMRIRLP